MIQRGFLQSLAPTAIHITERYQNVQAQKWQYLGKVGQSIGAKTLAAEIP